MRAHLLLRHNLNTTKIVGEITYIFIFLNIINDNEIKKKLLTDIFHIVELNMQIMGMKKQRKQTKRIF